MIADHLWARANLHVEEALVASSARLRCRAHRRMVIDGFIYTHIRQRNLTYLRLNHYEHLTRELT